MQFISAFNVIHVIKPVTNVTLYQYMACRGSQTSRNEHVASVCIKRAQSHFIVNLILNAYQQNTPGHLYVYQENTRISGFTKLMNDKYFFNHILQI